MQKRQGLCQQTRYRPQSRKLLIARAKRGAGARRNGTVRRIQLR
jgi:hypothetical protein